MGVGPGKVAGFKELRAGLEEEALVKIGVAKFAVHRSVPLTEEITAPAEETSE